MDGVGNEVTQQIRNAIKGKLTELGAYVDDELPDYIMVMVANKKNKAQMVEDLSLFLGNSTEVFTTWLHDVLERLQFVTVVKQGPTETTEEPAKNIITSSTQNVTNEVSKEVNTNITNAPLNTTEIKTASSMPRKLKRDMKIKLIELEENEDFLALKDEPDIDDPLSDEYTKLYEVGEIWNDGPCKKCICENVSNQFVYSCEVEKCVVPSYFINKTEYVYEEQSAPGSCCPNYVLTACLADGKVYQVGSKWPSNDNDRCISFECVKGENGDVQIVQHILTCNKTCALYAKYIEPSSESLECCGYCEPFACEDRGIIYQIGEKWAPNSDNCVSVECVKQDGKIEKIRMGKQCPLIPSDCPMEHRIMDESGCCELCEIIPGACEAKSIPPEKSIHYFYLHDKVKGVCSNKEPIQSLAECSGRCQSQTVYSPSLDAFATTCKCCTPLESVIRPITLHCKDNSTIVKEYKQPKNCECSSCSDQKQPNNTLEVPPPVK